MAVAGEGELAAFAHLSLIDDAADRLREDRAANAIEDDLCHGDLAALRLAARLEIDGGGETPALAILELGLRLALIAEVEGLFVRLIGDVVRVRTEGINLEIGVERRGVARVHEERIVGTPPLRNLEGDLGRGGQQAIGFGVAANASGDHFGETRAAGEARGNELLAGVGYGLCRRIVIGARAFDTGGEKLGRFAGNLARRGGCVGGACGGVDGFGGGQV